MTPREARAKLDEIKARLVGVVLTGTGKDRNYVSASNPGVAGQYIPPDNNELAKAIGELTEIVAVLLAEREAELVRKGGF
jgi:hypothetical protein